MPRIKKFVPQVRLMPQIKKSTPQVRLMLQGPKRLLRFGAPCTLNNYGRT